MNTTHTNTGNFRMIDYIVYQGKKIKICCEAYETKKGDSLREVQWRPGEKNGEENFSPINEGFHLKFHPVAFPRNFTIEQFKMESKNLGLKICKETRHDTMYLMAEKFSHAMSLPDCALVAARWFKTHQNEQPKIFAKGDASHNEVVSKLEG